VGYADLASAKAQLQLSDENADDANRIALLTECDETVSTLFEQKAGYDAAQTPIWRGADADIDPTPRTVWGEIGYGDVVLLPVPATGITDVQIAGLYPETLTTADWIAWNADVLGAARSVRRIDGSYWPVRDGRTYLTVTALWADGPKAEDPPALVVNACTFLAVEEYRMRQMSPAGEIGPDGLSIRPRNPWGYELVKGAIESVRATAPMPVF
jgi:hypothetical protein